MKYTLHVPCGGRGCIELIEVKKFSSEKEYCPKCEKQKPKKKAKKTGK